MTSLLTFLKVSTLVVLLAEGTSVGAIKLDNYTFDKVLGMPGYDFLIKFDKSYAYGEKEDEFKILCKLAYSVPKLLVGEVPVQEYGDKENSDLQERFEIKKDDFPVYLLFNEANNAGARYTGRITAADIGVWLRKNRIKMPAIGTIVELDAIAEEFIAKGASDALLDAARALAEGEHKNDRKAGMYVRIMDKIKTKGADYVSEETRRVGALLDGKLTDSKKDELNDKLKILSMFNVKDEL